MATLTESPSENAANPTFHYYRSPSLLSLDRQYAAYSRIQIQVQAQFQSRATSILFIENLKTGDLQAVTPASPLADNPFISRGVEALGAISIVVPVSWSQTGNCLLAREFESLFGSDIASDYAVVVDCAENRVSTIAPTHLHYTTAILLGWSQSHPNQVLFRAGNLGDEHWDLWAVDTSGHTARSQDDRAVTFGHVVSSVWAGPQAH